MCDVGHKALHAVLQHESGDAVRLQPFCHLGSLRLLCEPAIRAARADDDGQGGRAACCRKRRQRDRLRFGLCAVPKPYGLFGSGLHAAAYQYDCQPANHNSLFDISCFSILKSSGACARFLKRRLRMEVRCLRTGRCRLRRSVRNLCLVFLAFGEWFLPCLEMVFRLAKCLFHSLLITWFGPRMASQVLMAVSGTPQKPCRLTHCPVSRRLGILVTTGTCESAMFVQSLA